MAHYVVFGEKGFFARSFRKKILALELGDCTFIPHSNFQPHALPAYTSSHPTIYIYTYGGKNQSFEKSNEFEYLERLLDVMPSDGSSNRTLVYISSGEVYGVNNTYYENSSLQPLTDYGKNKLKCENVILEKASRSFKTQWIFRLANAYDLKSIGEQSNLIANLVRSAQVNHNFHLIADLESRKQYGTYDSFAQAILESLTLGGLISQNQLTNVLNIAPPFSYSINEILEILDSFGLMISMSVRKSIKSENSLPMDSRELKSLFKNNFTWTKIEEEFSKNHLA